MHSNQGSDRRTSYWTVAPTFTGKRHSPDSQKKRPAGRVRRAKLAFSVV